ncbi:MAG: helix-turn-helix domain-containing protein [Ignavibacteriales bacterium]|nr:helix-turn-helix domain-containing protein [Ignavibacteriales bacterium]
MTEPTEQEKEKLLSQILSHSEFKSSKKYQDLLKYLVEKTTKVDSLKETEIAHDILGKDSTFDPGTDSIIRAYVSNLRKKLEHYYLTTNDTFDYKIDVPKGQYLVKYVPVQQKGEIKKRNRYPSFVYGAIILLLVSVILLREFTNQSASTPDNKLYADNPIWSNFLKQDSPPILIVIGDYLVLSEKEPTRRTFLRLPRINSEKAFNDSLRANPERLSKLEISDVTFIGAGPALGVVQLMQMLAASGRKVSAKLSHNLKWDDLDNHNIIYIGTFKSLYKLDTLFSRTNVRFHSPYSLKVIGREKEVLHSFDLDWLGGGGNYQKDYSVILKGFSEKNNSILFLTGFSEVGVMDAINSSLDPKLLARVKEFSGSSISNLSSNFELISEVEGLRYTVFRSHIKYAHN